MLLLSFLMIMLTVVVAVAVLLDARSRELAHAKSEVDSLSRILAEQTTRTFESVALMMRSTRERLSDDIGHSLELDSQPVQWLLSSRVAGLSQVKSLFIVTGDGLGINSSRKDFIRGLSVEQRSFFRHFADGASDEIFISLPEKARVDGQWTFYVSSRLLDAKGKFRGVLVAAINIEYFETLYESISLDFVDKIQLLNKDGMLLAGKPHDEANFGRTGINVRNLEGLADNAKAFVAGKEETEQGTRFITLRRIADYPLIISAAVDEHEALTPWRHIAKPIIIGVILIVIFVLGITFLMVRNLLRQEYLKSELKESDEQLRHMVHSVRDAIITVDAKQHIVLYNPAAASMFGFAATEAIGCKVDEWLARCSHPPLGDELKRYLQEGLHSPPGLALLGIIELRGEGQSHPVELSLSTTTVHDQILVTAVFRDLAERQRAEQELVATNRQLHELSASLQNIREEERTRIARELHDELGQLLTGIRMEVSWLGGRLPAELQVLIDKAGAIKGLIDQTIASVRRISSELRPLVLDDLGFSAAAGWYVDQYSARTGLQVSLELPLDDPRQDDAVATALFRVLQESLTNIARHAKAGEVRIRLARRGNEWILTIHDNGIGCAPESRRKNGFGLIGMRERVHSLGGRFAVTSLPGQGTTVEAIISAAEKNEDDNGKIQSTAG